MSNYDKIKRLLGEPIRNIAQSFYDDFVEANVKFRSRSGLKTFIIRQELAKCCKWCHGLAGIYNSEDAPQDIYRRHDSCRCMVTFKNEKGYTNVWNKKEFDTYREARISAIKELEKAKRIEKSTRLDIIEKRKKFGALNDINDPNYKKREAHAIQYYRSIRNSNIDYIANTISRNTGIDSDVVRKMIMHLFINKHDLDKGHIHFEESYDIAESVRRLREGKNIQRHDITLIYHEAEESYLMYTKGLPYEQAHDKVNEIYNYGLELMAWKRNNR